MDFKEILCDNLSCRICLERISNAIMCPNCKKLCCEQCIKVSILIFLYYNRNGCNINTLVPIAEKYYMRRILFL